MKSSGSGVLMVCFVFPPRFSGAAMQAIVLARHLIRRGVPCEFLVPNVSDRSLLRRSEEGGIIVNRVAGGSYSFALSFVMFLLLRRNDFRTVHFHGFSPGHFLCVGVAKLLGMQIVQKMTKGGVDDSELNTSGLLGRYRSRILKLIDCFIAISTQLHQALLKHGVPVSKIHMIPNGVERESILLPNIEKRTAVRGIYGIPSDAFVGICAGVIDRRKNTLDIARALGYLCANNLKKAPQRVRFIFAGPFHNPQYSHEVVEYIESSNLSKLVLFTGQLNKDALIDLYVASDLCVFAGSNEGLPNVLLEAKAVGLPVVAYRTYGVEEVVQDGIDGFLVPFGQVQLLAEKIALFLEDTELRRQFSINAFRDCQKRYDLTKIAEKYVAEVYI
jgi:glycosyltransferase involved in cell wall biosynthesis